MTKAPIVDPVCLIHGKRRSEHNCLYCCLCFRTLTPDECWEDENDIKWDVCIECAKLEELAHGYTAAN
jgi:hypothetical protein